MSILLPERRSHRGRLLPRCVVAIAESDAREELASQLELDGYAVAKSGEGFSALRQAREGADALVLDLRIPGADAFTIIRTLRRERCQVPIVALARGCDEAQALLSLELGADSYLPHPVSPALLASQIRAVLRRDPRFAEHASTSVYLDFGRVVIDESAREARIDEVPLALRPREFAILLVLARHAGAALSRRALVERVWGDDFEGDERTVDSHIRRVRAQIERFPTLPPCIHTIHGFGYKFDLPEAG